MYVDKDMMPRPSQKRVRKEKHVLFSPNKTVKTMNKAKARAMI